MPFAIDLLKTQRTKKWTFRKTDASTELQALLDKGDRKGYGELLIELSKESNGGHKFTRTKGIVYELFDEGETIDVPVKFKVKNSVITWEFVAPMDRTHQAFRDLVFNTAAKAHACVDNSCETYYRGTNHYHLKVMHTYAQESEHNHNHYRTKNDGPITPLEVYQHLFAFYAQKEGKQFISSPEERNNIILTFAMYWAEFNADIKYMPFLLLTGNTNENAIKYQLENIARIGALTPKQASAELDQFFASEHGKNMFKLVPGIKPRDLENAKDYLKALYEQVYFKVAPKSALEMVLDPTLEPQKVSTPSSKSSSKRSSPREEYDTSPDQVLDEIDLLEYEAFASDLTKHCQSINKELLEDLTLEDFRKGLMLYHALRTVQQELQVEVLSGQRFHPDLTTDSFIKEMLRELPSIQGDSTEDSLGSTLLNRLVTWLKDAPPELDAWVEWVKVNGSRGLGSEIALVRLDNGDVDLRQAIPQGDRKPGDNIAEIDFDKIDLRKIFLPDLRSTMKEEDIALKMPSKHQIGPLIQLFSEELSRLVSQQLTEHRLEKEEFQAKTKIINLALAVLQGKTDVSVLLEEVNRDKKWLSVSSLGFKSKLEGMVQQVLELYAPSKTLDLTF
ncbi:hypothetical protein Lgra_0576 [Legionella gratiana]|uniref:Uncharacterized protein n=1 Tax=Legionella gratiana TaxID=45066 RepID=A0A378J2B3_9GAMM|nr:hypothetical protein [Legionella gratiana]KTD14545.1 hypothetical protein Lgra_0576 [Legionella gratiana]STX41884.1 Uncharacterised protein [Legionella gratiana]